jgi:hypothetical protein
MMCVQARLLEIKKSARTLALGQSRRCAAAGNLFEPQTLLPLLFEFSNNIIIEPRSRRQ